MQRALDKTETMKARAAAIEGLPATSRFQEPSALGPAEADVDRELEQLGMQSTVDDELAKLKKEFAPLADSTETASSGHDADIEQPGAEQEQADGR